MRRREKAVIDKRYEEADAALRAEYQRKIEANRLMTEMVSWSGPSDEDPRQAVHRELDRAALDALNQGLRNNRNMRKIDKKSKTISSRSGPTTDCEGAS